LDLEVVAAVLDDNVAKGIVRVGMSREDVRQAVGEPSKVEEVDSTSIWSFSKGNYKQIKFNADGLVTDTIGRPIEDQISLGMTAAAAKEVLGLAYPNERATTDGGILWLGVTGLNKNLRFDSNFHTGG
jgi:hypothetical protein